MNEHISFIKKTLKDRGCTEIKISKGHMYFSGFFTAPSGQIYYISWHDGNDTYLVRTAKDYKDFRGGTNQWFSQDDLKNAYLKGCNDITH